ncbi:potassium channel family protein [Streptococcus caprae]|uniref:Potassium channel family protein n=1 Tax=Streptococcus caprae TaxID=1640501 RepID=A0ABV8CW30_9STRE
MQRKIIGVLGLGIFGQTLAKELSQFDQEVIAIDFKESHIEAVADLVSRAVIGDITDLEFLRYSGIDQCDTVIIATGNNLEASVLAVMNCKKLGVQQIIAKAKSDVYEEVLYSIGANVVISPERQSAKISASEIMRSTIDSIFHLEGDISLVEFTLPQEWVGKTVKQLNIRQKYDLNLIGIRKEKTGPVDTHILVDKPLEAGVTVLAIANSRTFEEFDYLGYLS